MALIIPYNSIALVRLSEEQWEKYGFHLRRFPKSTARGRKPSLNLKEVAEACLFHYRHSLSMSRNTFGWHRLPTIFHVSGATANRFFRFWRQNGDWERFHEAVSHTLPTPARGIQKMAPALPARPLAVSLAPALRELERAFSFFNARLFNNELPVNVLIIVQESSERECGFFRGNALSISGKEHHLIAVSLGSLYGSVHGTLGTLLHEMVHLRNFSLGILDVGARFARYHNMHFRDAAETAGLECSCRSPNYGFASTALNQRGKAAVEKLHPREDVLCLR